MPDSAGRDGRLRRHWDRQAGGYDRSMAAAERRFFAGTRQWLCAQATGDTLEVAVGTGLNLPYYPDRIALTGVEWSPAMLAIARGRAGDLAREADLRVGDARALEFPDRHFDTVVCTFALCGISGGPAALTEMARVLRPGGLLLLADHVASTVWPVRAVQALVDLATVPLYGERFSHRPLPTVRALGFTLERHERLRMGIIERLAARKPAA